MGFAEVKFVEEWIPAALNFVSVVTFGPDNWEFTTTYVTDSIATFMEEEWEQTTYLDFGKHADTWAPTIFFTPSVFEEEWDLTILLAEDSFGPLNSTDEEWELTEYLTEDSFGPLGVFTDEEWEPTDLGTDSFSSFFNEEWES